MDPPGGLNPVSGRRAHWLPGLPALWKFIAVQHPRLLASISWLLIGSASIFYLVSLPYRYWQLHNLEFAVRSPADVLRGANPLAVGEALSTLHLSTTLYAGMTLAIEVLYTFTFVVIGYLIFYNHHAQHFRWITFLALTMFGVGSAGTTSGISNALPALASADYIVHNLGWLLITAFIFVFPNGRFVPSWAGYVFLTFAIWQLSWMILPGSPLNPLTWSPGVTLFVWMLLYGGMVLAQVYRYQNVSDEAERHQTRWVLYGMILTIWLSVAINIPNVFLSAVPRERELAHLYSLIYSPLTLFAVLLTPLSIGAAILKRRLWDIDLIINRTMVYVPLTAILAGLYTASIRLFQAIFGNITGNRSDAAVVITTLILASAFTPLKNWLQGRVDRAFKETPQRTRAFSEYSVRLEAAVVVLDPAAVAERFLELILNDKIATGACLRWTDASGQMNEIHAGNQGGQGGTQISISIERQATWRGELVLYMPTRGRNISTAELRELRQGMQSFAHLLSLHDHPHIRRAIRPRLKKN